MSNYHFATLVVILAAVWCGAQDSTLNCTIKDLQDNAAANHQDPIDLTDLIPRDECAMAAAGSSKDPRYIPYQKKIEKSRKERSGDYNGNAAALAQMALAKLGVEQDLFEIECEIQPKASKYVRVYAIKEKLAYVGGSFAIQLAKDMLPNNERNKEYLYYGDYIDTELYPQKLAITFLPDLFGPDSEPLKRFGRAQPRWEKFKGLTEEQVIDGWYHWILDHESELKKLEPTGESVHYSEARCEKYLKGQKALLHTESGKP